jgi:hypothetical protein
MKRGFSELGFIDSNWKGGSFLIGREGRPMMQIHSTPANGLPQALFRAFATALDKPCSPSYISMVV